MANKTYGQFLEKVTIIASDIFPIQDGATGITKFVTAQAIADFVPENAVPLTESAVSTTTDGSSIIGITDTTAVRTVTVDSAAILIKGQKFQIKDQSGGSFTNNIIIATEGSQTIDGQSTLPIVNNYGVMRLYSNGSNLFTE
jgi:hypothetical protein